MSVKIDGDIGVIPIGNASGVAFTPVGGIAATNVQAALQEVDAEKLSLTGGMISGDLFVQGSGGVNITTGNITAGEFYARNGQVAAANSLTRKDYVDGFLNRAAGGTMTGNIRMQKGANQSAFIEFCAAAANQRSAAIVGQYDVGVWEGLLLLAGNNAASYKFYATGTAYAPIGWQPSSDARVKSEITPMVAALQRLNQIDGCTYKRLDVGDPDKVYGGFIAQSVREVLPEAVDAAMLPTEQQVALGIDKDDRILSIDTTAILALAVQSIKELSAKLDAALTRITELESKQ